MVWELCSITKLMSNNGLWYEDSAATAACHAWQHSVYVGTRNPSIFASLSMIRQGGERMGGGVAMAPDLFLSCRGLWISMHVVTSKWLSCSQYYQYYHYPLGNGSKVSIGKEQTNGQLSKSGYASLIHKRCGSTLIVQGWGWNELPCFVNWYLHGPLVICTI